MIMLLLHLLLALINIIYPQNALHFEALSSAEYSIYPHFISDLFAYLLETDFEAENNLQQVLERCSIFKFEYFHYDIN